MCKRVPGSLWGPKELAAATYKMEDTVMGLLSSSGQALIAGSVLIPSSLS